MKIRFLETYTVKGRDGETFLQGKIYDLPGPSAQHFLNKGRAEIFVHEPEKPLEEETPATIREEWAKPPEPITSKPLSQRATSGRKAGKRGNK